MLSDKDLNKALDSDLVKDEEELDIFDADLRATNPKAKKQAEDTTKEDIENKLGMRQFRRMIEVNSMIMKLIY